MPDVRCEMLDNWYHLRGIFPSLRGRLLSRIEFLGSSFEKGRSAMPRRLIVVGGGAGGPSAAAKAKRVDPKLEVTILEAGEHVSFSA